MDSTIPKYSFAVITGTPYKGKKWCREHFEMIVQSLDNFFQYNSWGNDNMLKASANEIMGFPKETEEFVWSDKVVSIYSSQNDLKEIADGNLTKAKLKTYNNMVDVIRAENRRRLELWDLKNRIIRQKTNVLSVDVISSSSCRGANSWFSPDGKIEGYNMVLSSSTFAEIETDIKKFVNEFPWMNFDISIVSEVSDDLKNFKVLKTYNIGDGRINVGTLVPKKKIVSALRNGGRINKYSSNRFANVKLFFASQMLRFIPYDVALRFFKTLQEHAVGKDRSSQFYTELELRGFLQRRIKAWNFPS